MRRALLGFCALFATVAVPATGTAQAAGPLQINKTIARRDARVLLTELRLPSDTPARHATQPPLPALVPPRVTGKNSVGVSGWWTTRASQAAVLAYVKAHLPKARGELQVVTEPPSTTIYSWMIDGPHLYSQQLQLTVATLADGRTGIMAQAQSTWMIPRKPSERVPASVASVQIMLRIGTGLGGMKREHTHRYRFTSTAKVSAIVNLVDALPISQPGVLYMCAMLLPNRPDLTLRFLSAHGSTLARVQVYVYPGTAGASGWNNCDPISFWIGAKQQTPLTSHTFVRRIGRLIGANLS